MKGFTLVELIIVLAITGVLAWLALTGVYRAEKAKLQFMSQCPYPKPECESQWAGKL